MNNGGLDCHSARRRPRFYISTFLRYIALTAWRDASTLNGTRAFTSNDLNVLTLMLLVVNLVDTK